jgi:hypothetical protein
MLMFSISAMGALSFSILFAAMPSSSNYQLHNYNYGSGGGTTTSTNYSINGTTGQISNVQSTSTNFISRPGNNNTQQAYVPPAPTFTNPANYYNKLHFIVNPDTNPSDTKFSIAISSDDFVTTYYVQNDNTISLTRGLEDYQTYAAWGSGSGQLIIGLNHSTTYKLKVNAFQGSFTETEYGPSATAATVAPSITFDIDVASTDTETSPPFATSFGNLLPATVTTAANKIWVDVDTNAESGVKVYINSQYTGLRSNSKSFTLASASADLAPASTGYGAQGSSATQSSGGPLTITAPYNVAAQNVGILDTSLRQIFSTTTPVTGGRGSLQLMAKAATMTPASDDYQDTLTMVVAASF